ncbi:diguanylate cyclase domain-containing protein [Clostridium folliculivorans]|uniref:Diguanylate cyclase n=1 Tax=Clostridium folliculivorans TaxID=2886038 RepID=A0A9W5XZ08_9CLOT|nr:diguanylate cyclase [Clostridium folliculivorans]GKU23501.1 hypothetical protein CFOLD11_03270 [Clostridium folliculivorans]GKU29617.1 hypothetical protein CFB3_17240 [Clostridium folliculivorans]
MRLLKPSIALMRNLRYIKKFALIFAIILLPMSIMMSIFILQVSRQLNYASKQKIGLEYNIALTNLSRDIQKHRGMVTVFLSGDIDFYSYIKNNEKDIDDDNEKIRSLSSKYNKQLKVEEQFEKINKEWLEVKNNLNVSPLEKSFEEHTKLIADISDMCQSVADISELRIQSKIENYYLADNLINTLPQITEQMGQIRAVGAKSVAKGNLDVYDREALEFMAKSIKQNMKYTEKSMNVISKNISKKDHIEQPYKEAVKGTENLIFTLNDKLLYPQEIAINVDNYFSYATEMIDKVDKLSLVEATVLQNDYDEQIRQLEFSRNIITTVVVFILFIIIYLFGGFYKSILESILSIKAVAARIAKGDLSERIQLECKDEVKEIGDSVNKMLDKLIESYYEVQKARDLSEKIANHDWLTGVPNRAFFVRQLEEIIEELQETGGTVTILFIDLDRFKWINDNLGHQMGDIVLKVIAKRLVDITKKRGIVYRLGGDEFTIILKNISQYEEIDEFIKIIETNITKPMYLSEAEYSVGASIGHVTYPHEGTNIDELISKADVSMYIEKNKKKSKNIN